MPNRLVQVCSGEHGPPIETDLDLSDEALTQLYYDAGAVKFRDTWGVQPLPEGRWALWDKAGKIRGLFRSETGLGEAIRRLPIPSPTPRPSRAHAPSKRAATTSILDDLGLT